MRRLLLLWGLSVLTLPVLMAQATPDSPVVVKGEHYTVTSYAGADRARDTLALMEALLAKYNQLFLFDLSQLPSRLNVTVWATKDDFVKAMVGKANPAPQDFVFLQYTDPSKSTLECWADPDVRPLAFQGFYQYLWSFLPRTPSWIETGLAYHFWNVTWDGTTLSLPPEHAFHDALLARWSASPPTDLAALLTSAQANELDSWALVTFLLESADPVYARLMGSILGNLAPAASLDANRQGVLQRFQAAKPLAAASNDLVTWWRGQTSFSALIAQGVAQLKDKDAAGAQKTFQKALTQRPGDEQASYYQALATYELKDYAVAESRFGAIVGKTLPPGLLEYARGLNSFAQKKWDDAKAHLAKAVAENAAEYTKLVQAVLDLMK